MSIYCPKCGHQRTDNDDPNVPEGQCPACGIYYFKYLNQKSGAPRPMSPPPKPKTETKPQTTPPKVVEPETIRPEPTDAEKLLAYQEMATHKTSHLLHFFMSLITAGIWLIVWLIISATNTGERNKIRKKYNLPIEGDSAGNLIKIALVMFLVVMVMRGCASH